MKSFMKFLRRCWAGLKGLFSKKQIDNPTEPMAYYDQRLKDGRLGIAEPVITDEPTTEAGKALIRTAHEVRVEAKRLAKANLANNPRVDRKSFLRLLEAETDSMIRQLINLAGTQECAA